MDARVKPAHDKANGRGQDTMRCPAVVGRIIAIILAGAAFLAIATGALADSVAEFYRGQTITLLVGASTGGGYDTYARPVSRHLSRFIPGEPGIVIKYMPAAASLPAANTLYSIVPRDGLTMGLVQRHIPYELLRGNKAATYDPFRFNWLGSVASEVSVTIVSASAPHRTARDLLSIPLIAGSLGPETDSEIESNAMIHLLGAPMKLVRGYAGTPDVLLALERGELQGAHGISWSYIKTRKADALREGKLRVLLQTGLEAHPDLKDVATLYDLVSSPEVRQVWDLIFTPKRASRPFVLPPEVPLDRVAALRTAFERLVQDPAFLAEMERIQYEISFVSGAEMESLIRKVYAYPPGIVATMLDAISSRDKPARP
jgi:tripartite-type tricarboxylate transporter receptor subunit TctC